MDDDDQELDSYAPRVRPANLAYSFVTEVSPRHSPRAPTAQESPRTTEILTLYEKYWRLVIKVGILSKTVDRQKNDYDVLEEELENVHKMMEKCIAHNKKLRNNNNEVAEDNVRLRATNVSLENFVKQLTAVKEKPVTIGI